MYYAKQVQSDSYVGDLYLDFKEECKNRNLIICGNRDLTQYNVDILRKIDDMYSDVENGYYTLTEVVNDQFTKPNGKKYTGKDIAALKQFVDKYLTDDDYAQILSVIFQTPYEAKTMRGCCQGDWQIIYCPADFDIDYIEAVYMGTGTEYKVWEDDETEDDCVWFYCEDGYKETLAKHLGTDVDNIRVAYVTGQYTTTHYTYSDFE